MQKFNSETLIRYLYIAPNVGAPGAGADYKIIVREAAEALIPAHLVPPSGPLPAPAVKYADKIEGSIIEALGNGRSYEARGYVITALPQIESVLSGGVPRDRLLTFGSTERTIPWEEVAKMNAERAASRTYTLRDDASAVEVTIEATDDEDARAQAEAWAREGDWNTPDRTIWIDVRITDDEGDHEVVTVAIGPDEPECSEGEHSWKDEGVRGHGGGVVIVEACKHCGVKRITDTWAQRPDTGEQGLTSTRYQPSAGARAERVGIEISR